VSRYTARNLSELASVSMRLPNNGTQYFFDKKTELQRLKKQNLSARLRKFILNFVIKKTFLILLGPEGRFMHGVDVMD